METVTLIGIFDDGDQAQQAERELARIGVSDANITVARSDFASSSYTTSRGTTSTGGGGIGGFFSNLFGTDVEDDDRGIYSEAVRRGSVVVTAQVDDSLVDRAVEVLNAAGAIDVDQRAAQYRASGYTQFDENASLYSTDQTRSELETFGGRGEVALPVIEEELQVGKRAVRRGGVRIHTRTTERPVEESVTLREERVHVERRPVNREVTDADFAEIKDGVLEITEKAEEAVVAKQARVVEEVVVGKDVVEREETVRDTVRRTDVDVENVAAGRTTRKDDVTSGRTIPKKDPLGV